MTDTADILNVLDRLQRELVVKAASLPTGVSGSEYTQTFFEEVERSFCEDARVLREAMKIVQEQRKSSLTETDTKTTRQETLEPTEAMLDAGIKALPQRYDLFEFAPERHRVVFRREMRDCWKAMKTMEDNLSSADHDTG